MIQTNTSRHPGFEPQPLYTREAFRALLARQPEWKVRAALEEGNIPSSNIEHALEWLEEQEQEAHQAQQHQGYWS
jgi:hypothetical protein